MSPTRSSSRVSAAAARAPSPGPAPAPASRAAEPAACSRSPAACFGEFVRSQACPDCGGTGRLVESPCADCAARAHGGTRRACRSRSRPGSTTASASGSRAGARGQSRRSGRRRLRPRPRQARRAVRARGRRRLLDHRPHHRRGCARRDAHDRDARRRACARLRRGHAAGQIRVPSGRGMPVLQGFGRGAHRVLVNVLVPAPTERRAARPCSRSSSRLTGEENYRPDEGFFDKLKSAFR